MNGEQRHRFAITGHDPDGGRCTLILWRQLELVHGTTVARVVLTLDSTRRCMLVLLPGQGIELGEAIRVAASGSTEPRGEA